MSGGQEERKRILVLTYIETFSTGNAVTPVYLEMFFGRVEFILKSPSVFVGRFGAVGKTHKVHPVHFEEIGCQGLRVQSAGNADTEVSATYQFFGDDVDRCAADITAAACVEGFVDTYSCEDDARITRVILTEKGHQMTQKINDLTNVVLEQSFEGLTPLQIEKTMESLKHIFKNLSR